jgi:hypothetical protein
MDGNSSHLFTAPSDSPWLNLWIELSGYRRTLHRAET